MGGLEVVYGMERLGKPFGSQQLHQYLVSALPGDPCDGGRCCQKEEQVALSVSAATDENAARALAALPALKGCEAHSTVILSAADANTFRRIGVNLTCDARYQSHKLYHGKS